MYPLCYTVGILMFLTILQAGPRDVEALEVVFGPKEYVRTQGSANVFNESFGTCWPTRSFRLRVENGPRGLVRLKSGSVTLNGQEVVTLTDSVGLTVRPVSLDFTNSVQVTLGGPRRGTLAVSIDTDPACTLRVAVMQPSAGATLSADLVLVRGTVEGAPEVGVLVNGVPAAVQEGVFGTVVPITPSTTELVVLATTPLGETGQVRHSIGATEPAHRFQFRAWPAAGGAPLPVRFALWTTVAVAEVALDLEGDGPVDFRGPTLAGQPFSYGVPGLYFPAVAVLDDQNQTHATASVVAVYDLAALDALLQAKWASFKDALRGGDLDVAVGQVIASRRAEYRDALGQLTVPYSQIDQVLTDLSLVSVDEGRVEYQMIRVSGVGRLSFPVVFVRDEVDGLWRIRFF